MTLVIFFHGLGHNEIIFERHVLYNGMKIQKYLLLGSYSLSCNTFHIYRHRSQRSPPIRLYRRRVYCMEALMKEGGGGDHISVGMRIGRRIKPIPSKYLYMVPPGKK